MWRRVLRILGSVTLGALLWQVVWVVTGGIGFSSVFDTLARLCKIAGTSSFWGSLGSTMVLTLSGLSVGLLLALAVGLGIGSSPVLDLSTRGSLNFVRSLPSVILLPLFMASVGSSSAIVVYLVATIVSFKLIVFVIMGVRDADLGLRDYARVLGFGLIERTLLLRLPSAAILVLTGLRLSAIRAYGAVVLAGVVAGTPGIGGDIGFARLSADPSPVLAYAIVAGLVGIVFFTFFSGVEKRLVVWANTR